MVFYYFSKNTFYLFFLVFLLIASCAKSRIDGEWSIDKNRIVEGEGENDIPAINEPKFTPAREVNFLTDSSLVLGLKVENQIRAYPLDILQWHEVVNDQIGTQAVAITYSTLTGSGIAFDRNLQNYLLTFCVSGLLFESNTIYCDKQSSTEWLQFLRRGVKGTLDEMPLTTFPLVEMNWKTWKRLFPTSSVLNLNTGFNRPYSTYPYGDYREDSTKVFFDLPINTDSLNQILSLKEKILGVIVGEGGQVVKGYHSKLFSDDGFSIIEEEVNGEPILVIGSQAYRLMMAYSRKTIDGKILNFGAAEDENSLLLIDNEGNYWDIFGQSIENPNLQLEQVPTNIAYWFAWATFYPAIDIF